MSLKQQLHNYEALTNRRCNESRRFVNFVLCGGQNCREIIQQEAYYVSLNDPALRATFQIGNGPYRSPINWDEAWCHSALTYLSTHPSTKSQEYSDLIQKWLVAKPCTPHDWARHQIQETVQHRDRVQRSISNARHQVGHSIMDPIEAYDVEIPGTSAHTRRNYIDNVRIPQLQEQYQQYRDRIQQQTQELQDLGPEPTSDSESEEDGASNDTSDATNAATSSNKYKRKHDDQEDDKDRGDHKRRCNIM